jgi:hypothetical protein
MFRPKYQNVYTLVVAIITDVKEEQIQRIILHA